MLGSDQKAMEPECGNSGLFAINKEPVQIANYLFI
jgi:hypothetical protein